MRGVIGRPCGLPVIGWKPGYEPQAWWPELPGKDLSRSYLRMRGAGKLDVLREGKMTAYPPPATGTNYNMISAVGYGEGEHVFWMVMHSPEGRFVYDYKIRKSLNNKTPAKRLKSEAAFEALMKQRIAENAHGIVEATKPYQDSGAPTKCAREVPAL